MAGAWRGSLRARLMVGVVLLAAVGMVAVNAVSLLGLRLNLVDAADTTLTKTRDSVQHQVHRPTSPINLDNLNSLIPDGAYIAMVDDQGRVVAQTPTRTADGQARSRPDLPTPLPDDFAGHIVTVSSQDAPLPRYRTLSFPLGYSATVQRPGGPPRQFSRVVIAKSLKPADDAIYWLIGSDSAATLAVLGGIVLLSRGVLGVGLRPLRDMAATATAIAGGDLDQRIEVAQRHSEVGEVGTALNRAFDERQRSEEQLRQFVANASHELRTPLTTIRGWAQLHLHGLAQDPALIERAMLRIEGEATRMHTMVEELLLLARLDQGRPIAHAPVDLGALADDAVTDARVVDPGRPLTVEVPGEVFARGDEDRLRQVLQNLLSNALRHTPPDTPVSVTARALPDGTVQLAVTDQGPGMPPATAERIFERFYRGDESRNPTSGGTGLGLSIVRSIAEAHDGTATVRTAPGKGSTFTITLPAAR
ncbi:sensor histidine kinase [Streptomyces platensis]|uniref:histidine kinase n=1 Tax=Streptomyces platensis TaxID=58346 RepID=A0AAE6TP34_STRPT|nr:HAMP domain-containing sensor histidine kinase [Streptomyces platensis]OSY40504.1 putative sensor histidine kinase TcrY [Streptomyces platensis]QEV54120.1 sensor histidine kinase [Streptomyces platensis]